MPEVVSCPECSKRLRVPETLLNRTVKCPNCGNSFTATAGTAGPIVEDAVIDEPPRRPDSEAFRDRRPDEEDEDEPRPCRRQRDDDDYDDEYDRPRRRRRGRRSAAESKVMGPAIALLIVGGLGILLAIANVFLAVLVHAAVQQNDAGLLGGRIVVSVVNLIWGIVVMLSGFKLKSLQSYGSVMTGVIFAMLPCNLACGIGLFIGIWALVVMNDREVKDAFRRG